MPSAQSIRRSRHAGPCFRSFRTPRRAQPAGGRAELCGGRESRAQSVPSGGRAAIVTTVKDFAALAESWCAYHLAVGFAHLYIYFDDADELKSVDLGSRFPADQVTCIPHDAQLRAAWAHLPKAAAILPYAASEVQTRQKLNACHAMAQAVKRQLDWLLHIDADELFDPGLAGSATTHFANLSQRGVSTFCYMNFEAVPESHAIRDPFRDVTLFKRSLEIVEHTPEAVEAVGMWQHRVADSFFYYYDNGKAAARVHPASAPLSVHEWLPGSADGMQHWYSNLRDCWPGRGPLGKVVQHLACDARILHYPCYSYEALWVRWRRGNDNYRLGGREAPPPLHAAVCAAANAAFACGGEEAARRTVQRFFVETVMLTDRREVELQQRAGVCERITTAASTLERAAKRHR